MLESLFTLDGLQFNYISNLVVVLIADQLLHTLLLFIVVLMLCLVMGGRYLRLQLALMVLVCMRPLIPVHWQTDYSLRELVTELFPTLEALPPLFQLERVDLVMLLSGPMFLEWPFFTRSMMLSATWLFLSTLLVWRLFRLRRRYWKAVDAAVPVGDPAVLELLERVRKGLGVKRRVELVAGSEVVSVFTIGTLRPVIFLPDTMLCSLGRGAMLTLLAHEMAHIKRCDDLWGMLIAIVQRIFFFFPVFWFIGRHWEEQREIVCDSLAMKSSRQSAGEYADGLLDIVHYFRNRGTASERNLAPSLSLRRRGYRARLLALREYSLPYTQESALVLSGILLVIVFVMPMHSPEAASVALQERSRAALPPNLERLNLPLGPEHVIDGLRDIRVKAPLGLGTLKFVHNGLDIRLPKGAPVLSPGPGTVVGVVDSPIDGIAKRTGGYVEILHDNGVMASYHYVGFSTLEIGQRITAGEEIGRVLANKYSPRVFSEELVEGGGPPTRLHISMSYNGVVIDPEHVIAFSEL